MAYEENVFHTYWIMDSLDQKLFMMMQGRIVIKLLSFIVYYPYYPINIYVYCLWTATMHSTVYFVAAIAAASANVGSHVRLSSPTLINAHHLSFPTYQ